MIAIKGESVNEGYRIRSGGGSGIPTDSITGPKMA